jgi:phage terminase large subunit-like protein
MVHHVGSFPELEDQLAQFNTEGYQGGGSPDRADALVWALTELMLGETPAMGMLVKRKNRRAA